MDLTEARQKKERGMSVRDVLEKALAECNETDSIVIVRKMNDGTIPTSFSWESSLESLGLLEIAKADVVGYMET